MILLRTGGKGTETGLNQHFRESPLLWVIWFCPHVIAVNAILRRLAACAATTGSDSPLELFQVYDVLVIVSWSYSESLPSGIFWVGTIQRRSRCKGGKPMRQNVDPLPLSDGLSDVADGRVCVRVLVRIEIVAISAWLSYHHSELYLLNSFRLEMAINVRKLFTCRSIFGLWNGKNKENPVTSYPRRWGSNASRSVRTRGCQSWTRLLCLFRSGRRWIEPPLDTTVSARVIQPPMALQHSSNITASSNQTAFTIELGWTEIDMHNWLR